MSPRTEQLFERILSLRTPILLLYAALLPAAIWLSVGIGSDAGISRLVVQTDPDLIATRAFERIFPESPVVILLLEADDPWRPEVLRATEALEKELRAVPGATPYSAIDVYLRAHPTFVPDETGSRALRAFATGSGFFRKQGLVGDRFQGIAVGLASKSAAERDRLLSAIDAVIARAPLQGVEVHRVGFPYVEAWIERASNQATLRFFPVFAAFVIALVLFLYRSWRTLAAMLLALGATVACAVAAGRLLGYSFTVVSALVPLTVMVTTLANLVYLQSRFVDQPEGADLASHHTQALANKALPVTASTLAAVLGFAALSVSSIRPVREMGIWTAVGLGISWVTVFTLFPALQQVMRTPTARSVAIRTALYDRIAAVIPWMAWRFRWALVGGALVLALAGLAALTGVPGRIAPMQLGVSGLDYVDAAAPIHRDMRFYEDQVGPTNVTRLWVTTPPGALSEPEVLRGLERFTVALEGAPGVTSVVGPTTFLRLRRYLATGSDALPDDPAAFASLAADFEQLLLTEPELRGFVDPGTMANAQLTVIFRGMDEKAFRALESATRAAWDRTVAGDRALQGASLRLVGDSLLRAKIAANLVPTLAESFALTAALIFVVFLLVFRSASARLLAMIPSVFAILVTFLGMRLTGTPLNIATILIATTVLGTTENDQIHFFHHLHEGEHAGDLETALRHALRVSGRAIVFATLINSAGFLGLALSSFPPLRQFGVVTSAAFLLALLADLTALPAALWIASRRRPTPR